MKCASLSIISASLIITSNHSFELHLKNRARVEEQMKVSNNVALFVCSLKNWTYGVEKVASHWFVERNNVALYFWVYLETGFYMC